MSPLTFKGLSCNYFYFCADDYEIWLLLELSNIVYFLFECYDIALDDPVDKYDYEVYDEVE